MKRKQIFKSTCNPTINDSINIYNFFIILKILNLEKYNNLNIYLINMIFDKFQSIFPFDKELIKI